MRRGRRRERTEETPPFSPCSLLLNPLPFLFLSEAFDLFDTDGTGAIDAKELKVALR